MVIRHKELRAIRTETIVTSKLRDPKEVNLNIMPRDSRNITILAYQDLM